MFKAGPWCLMFYCILLLSTDPVTSCAFTLGSFSCHHRPTPKKIKVEDDDKGNSLRQKKIKPQNKTKTCDDTTRPAHTLFLHTIFPLAPSTEGPPHLVSSQGPLPNDCSRV